MFIVEGGDGGVKLGYFWLYSWESVVHDLGVVFTSFVQTSFGSSNGSPHSSEHSDENSKFYPETKIPFLF